MDTWGVVFLGIIALSAAIQAVFLVALLFFGKRIAQRVDALGTRLDRDLTPALENLTRASRAAAEVADMGALQARRLDLLLTDTADKVERTTTAVQRFVTRPMAPLGTAMAFVKGVQRGAEVFFGSERERGERKARRRRDGGAEDDDHLFI